MKKILTLALVLTIILLNFACTTAEVEGCGKLMAACIENHQEKDFERFEATFETDGVFKYYRYTEYYYSDVYNEEGIEAYAVVGVVDDLSDTTLYIPPYFNGKPVTAIGWGFRYGYMGKKDYCLPRQKCVYYPYTVCDGHRNVWQEKGFVCKWDSKIVMNHKTYLNRRDFEEHYTYKSSYEQGKHYCDVSDGFAEHMVIIANTTFSFNYEDAPNDGYFFINDFERGGLIENTPYEPTREGYVFAGWYKQPECINPWNFETDTLPEAEYDENGELVFVETILYAGWNKI